MLNSWRFKVEGLDKQWNKRENRRVFFKNLSQDLMFRDIQIMRGRNNWTVQGFNTSIPLTSQIESTVF